MDGLLANFRTEPPLGAKPLSPAGSAGADLDAWRQGPGPRGGRAPLRAAGRGDRRSHPATGVSPWTRRNTTRSVPRTDAATITPSSSSRPTVASLITTSAHG